MDKLQMTLTDASKTPLVLLSCGSFSPVTYLHLRMFEMCIDWMKQNSDFEIVGCYISPVADAYQKVGLARADHRLNMCRLSVQDSSTIMIDDWEVSKPDYTRTAKVLDHFRHEINDVLKGIATPRGDRKPAQISMLSGADLIDSMSSPGIWAASDLEHILGQYGVFVIERSGTDTSKALAALQQYRQNIYTIPQYIQNDVSSTKIRTMLRRNMSVRHVE